MICGFSDEKLFAYTWRNKAQHKERSLLLVLILMLILELIVGVITVID